MQRDDIKILSEVEVERVAGGNGEYPDDGTDEYWQQEHLAYKTERRSIFGDPPQ